MIQKSRCLPARTGRHQLSAVKKLIMNRSIHHSGSIITDSQEKLISMIKDPFINRKFIVLTGNYGSGKTEIALNLALQYAKDKQVTLVDLDIVNPYFRSAEKADTLREAGIRVLMPTFALTTVDIPALPPEIQSVFEAPADKVIFDVGGDDTGAAALGRYLPSFMKYRDQTTVAMVVNCMRPLTETTEDITDLTNRIVQRGRLKIDVIINNTNLAGRTTTEMITDGSKIIREAASQMNIPTVMHAGSSKNLKESGLPDQQIEVVRMMVPEWMED